MTFCETLDKFLTGAVAYFSNVNTMNGIDLFDIGPSYISLGTTNTDKLYGCKLVGKSNRILQLNSIKDIASTVQYSQGQSEVFLYYVKRGDHQATYVFSYSANAINQIAHDLGINKLSGRSLIISLFDIYHIGNYWITEDNRLKYDQSPEIDTEYFVPWDLEAVSSKFKAKIHLAVGDLLGKGSLYQATIAYNKKTFNVVELYKADWEGSIVLRIDFGYASVNSRLAKYESVARFGDGKFYSAIQAVRNHQENQDTREELNERSCLVNSHAMLIGKHTNISITKLSNILGFEFIENYLQPTMLLKKTMLLTRDSSFDMLLPTEYVTQFFATSHKKHTNNNKFVWWYGHDISKNYIDYSLDENKSPHVIYTGATGAGKSRQAIAGLEQILGFDKKTKKARRFKDFNVRYCDVGYTAGNLAMQLKENYGEDVKIYPSLVSGLRFSLFDISLNQFKEAEKDDLKFMSHLVNFALDIQAGGKSTELEGSLTGGEMSHLMLIVAHLIENDIYSDRFLEEYEKDGGYRELLEDLYKKGFSKLTKVSELPDEYDFLRKPVLSEVLSEIDIWSKKDDYSRLERDELQHLSKKMNALKGLKFLTMHSNQVKTFERFTHIDFDEIKDSPIEFSIVYWMLVKDWIAIMKSSAKTAFSKGQGMDLEKTLFYVDEAHNFFVYESFAGLLIRAVKEFRKYGGVFFFLSQELDDAPQKVISQMGTKIFVVPPETKDKLGQIIEEYFGKMKESDTLVLQHITDFMMYIMYDNGSIGMKFESDPADDLFYKPNHPDFKALQK